MLSVKLECCHKHFISKERGGTQTHFYIIIARSVRIVCEMFFETVKTQRDILALWYGKAFWLRAHVCLFKRKTFFSLLLQLTGLSNVNKQLAGWGFSVGLTCEKLGKHIHHSPSRGKNHKPQHRDTHKLKEHVDNYQYHIILAHEQTWNTMDTANLSPFMNMMCCVEVIAATQKEDCLQPFRPRSV